MTVYDLKQAGLIPVGAAVTYKVLSALVNHLNNNGETIPEIQTANARETDLRDEINTILASNFRPDSVADGVAFDDTVFDELIGGTEEVSGADVENILLAKTASNVFSANADWWKQDASAVSDAASLDSQITAVFPNSVLASEGDEGYDTLQTGIQSFVDAYNSSSASDAGNTELSNILTESNKLSALNLASTRSTIKTSLSSDTTKESKVEAFQDALPSCIKKVRDYALAFGIEDKDSRDYIIENYPSSTVDDFKNTILPEKVTDYANKIVSSIKENKLDDAKRYFRSYFHISKFYRNPDYQNVPNGVVADIVEDICTKIASSTVENNETRVNNVIEEVLKEYFGCLISKDKSTGLSIGESVYDRVERWDRTCGYGNGSDMLNWGYVSNFIYDKLYNNTIGNSIITDVTNLFKNSGYNPDKDTFNSKINQILPYILINNNRYANYADTVRSGIYDRIKQLSGKGTNLDPGNDVLPIYRDWASSAFSSQSWRINYAEVLWPNVLAATFYCTRIPTINESRKEIIRNYINSRGSEEDKKGLLRQSLINIYTDSDGALNCLISISGYNLDWTARNESGAWYSDGFKHRPAEYEADGTTLKSEQGISTIGGTYLEVKKALDEIDKSATYTALGDAVKNTRVGALTTGDVLNETQATGVLTDNPDLAEPEDVKNAIYSRLSL